MEVLNTHSAASRYETFEPAEARRLHNRVEIHYTPKHGSWLNVADIELLVLSEQCLAWRIDERETLTQAVAALEKHSHKKSRPADWRFTTE